MMLSSRRFEPDRRPPATGAVPLGLPAETRLEPFGGSLLGLSRALTEVRARRLLEAKIEFVPHPSFDDPAMRPKILGPTPASPGGKAARWVKPPEGLSPFLGGLDCDPPLTREQEVHLFQKMNFLKHLAALRRGSINPAEAEVADLDLIEALQGEALAIKNQIIRANLRLVFSLVKKLIRPKQDFAELVSDGYVSLIHAIEKFDFSRGNKFSTYASWAIVNNLFRVASKIFGRVRLVTGHEAMLAAAPDLRDDDRRREVEQERRQEAIQVMLGRLTDRERKIIISHYGINGASEQTLKQLGRELGISKQRVCQIASRAQEKLRRIAEEQYLVLPAS